VWCITKGTQQKDAQQKAIQQKVESTKKKERE
jgi:hypothetical protein